MRRNNKIKSSKLLEGTKIQGMSIAPFCILIRPDEICNEVVIRHEEFHWNEQKRLFYIFWYISYLIQWIFKGYKNISFEIRARKAEKEYQKTHAFGTS